MKQVVFPPDGGWPYTEIARITGRDIDHASEDLIDAYGHLIPEVYRERKGCVAVRPFVPGTDVRAPKLEGREIEFALIFFHDPIQ